MGYLLSETLETFLRRHIEVSDPLLQALETEAADKHIAIINREVGQLLSLLMQLITPRRVLEIGTAIGYSTLWMAGYTKWWGGKIITIERHPERHRRAVQVFKEAGVDHLVQPLLGDASEIIPELTGSFDFIFVDAAKGQYLNWYPYLKQLLAPGGVLVTDNVLYRGLVLPNSQFPRRKKTMVTRLRQYLKEIQQPPFTSVILPLGDGVAVSFLQEESQ